MKRRKKTNGIKTKKIGRILASFCIILLMVVSLVPNSMLFAHEEQEAQQEEPVVQEVSDNEQDTSTTREPIDFGKANSLLKWQVDALQIDRKDAESKTIKPKNAKLEVMDMAMEDKKKLQLLFTFSIPSFQEDAAIVKGDKITIALPKEISVSDADKALPMHAYARKQYEENGFAETEQQEQIAECRVDKQNVMHITFLKNLNDEDKQEVFSVLPIAIQVPEKEINTSMSLQNDGESLQLYFLGNKKDKESAEAEDSKKTKNEKTPTATKSEEAGKQIDRKKSEETPKKTESKKIANMAKASAAKDEKKVDEKAKAADKETEVNNTQDKVTSTDVASHRLSFVTKQLTTKLQQLFALSPYRLTITQGLPDGFELVKISIQNKSGGYIDTDENRSVGFKFDVSLSDDFLISQLERVLSTMPNAPVFQGDAEKYDQAILAFLNREDVAENLAKLEYTFDLGETFQKANVAAKALKDSDGAKIGEYWITKGIAHVVFTNDMYYYADVSITCNFDVAMDDDANLSDIPQDVEFENGKLILKQIGSINDGNEPENTTKYTIDKDAPLKVSSTEIAYTITIKATDAKETLENKWFVDQIPAGLKVKQLFLVNGEKEEEITKYTNVDGELAYHITGKNVKEITFRLIVEADDTTYQNLIKAGSMDEPFVNQAFLKDEKKADNLAESNEVSTQMKVTFLKKEGKQQDLEGTKFNWTIQADTKLPYYKEGYLVDTFSYSDHTLAKGSSLNITFKGKTDTYVVDELEVKTSSIPYEELTVDKIKEIGGDTKKPFYYLYDTKDESKFEDETYQKQCVLLIPFDSYHGTTASEPVKIQYITELNLHGMKVDEYIANYRDENKQIGNKVNLLWNNREGHGPIPATWEDVVNFSKDVDTNVDVMNKKGTYYDPTTQMAYWDLEINRMGALIDPADGEEFIKVSDIFDKGAYDLSSFKVSYTEYHRNSAATETKTINDFKIMDGSGGKNHLVITMPAFTTDTYRIYHIQAKLTDANALSQQGTIKISNSAKMDASVNGKSTDVTINADMNIKNTLIIKEAVKKYNYQSHQFTWKVIINPNQLNIENAQVKDILETSTSFGKLISAVDQDGKDVKAKITYTEATETVDGIAHPIVNFALSDIAKKSYILEYTTTLNDTDVLLNMEDTTTFHNKVILTGDVKGSEDVTAPIQDASDTASVPVKNNQLEKGGEYDPEDGSITWTVYLNKDQANMKNLTFVENLREQLADDEASIQSLDQDSIKIYAVDMKEDGSVDTTNEKDVTDDKNAAITLQGYDGFSWKFNEDDRTTYKLTFKTYLNENAAGATIANEVYLKDPSDNIAEDSNSSDGGYDGSYDFEDNANKNPRPKLAICKVSANSTDITKDETKYLLNDAEFTIAAYEVQKGTTANDAWTLGKPLISYNKINIANNGVAYFLNVMNKDNMIYKLSETKAPKGYKTMAEPKFFRFVKKDEQDKDTDYKVTFDGHVYPIQSIVYGTNVPVEKIVIKDEPNDDATYSFIKKVPAKVENGVVRAYASAPKGLTFYLHAINGLEGKVKDRFVETNENGEVVFKQLDPGEYILTEVKSDVNLDVGGSFTLKVSLDKDGKYMFALQGNSNHGLSVQDGNLLNDYVKGTLTFRKYVKYKQGNDLQIVSDNQEPLAGVSFKLTATGSTMTNTGYTNTVTSGKDGSVTFTNLPVGEYSLQELKQDGYQNNPTTYKVIVKEETGDVLVSDENGIPYKGKKAKVEVSPSLTDAVIMNTPETGNVTLKKVINSTTSGITGLHEVSLAGVEFGLYRRIGNVTAKEPLYKATSDSDGNVSFNNVEYGDYVCKELSNLAYFNKTEDFTILRNAMQYRNASFTYDKKVANEMFTKTLAFHKQDRDGNALQNIGFTLYRRSKKSITKDTDALEDLQADTSVTSYYPYLNRKMNTDEKGNFQLKELPVGDYLLIEDGTMDDLQEGYNKVALQVQITKESVKVHHQDNFTQELIDAKYELKKEDIIGTNGWHELNPTNGSYTFINQRKFAYVQVKKQLGEQQADTFVKTDYSKAIKGCVFQINQVLDGKETAYIQVTTNENGEFPITDDGKLVGKDANNKEISKHLYYGSYTIEEISSVQGYQVMKGKTAFDINDEETTASHNGTVWISNEDDTKGYSIVGENKDGKTFINPLVRSAITLQKTGLEGTPLKDAVFAIYDGTTLAAYLAFDGNAYTLTNTYDGNKLDAKKTGIPYLYKDKETFKLLAGTYKVEEIVTPKGYQKASFQMHIADDGDVSYDNAAHCQITDKTLREEPIQFTIEKVNAVGEPLSQADFSLHGMFADGTTDKTLEEANQAQLLANTVYTIIETKAPDGYRCASKHPSIRFDAYGNINIVEAKDILQMRGKQLQFKDEPIQIQVNKIAKDTGKPLADASFTIKGKFANTTRTAITDLQSNAEGIVTLYGTDWNLIGGETYELIETKAPDGYALSSQKIAFTLDIYGHILKQESNRIEVENEPIDITLEKYDGTNQASIDATFVLIDQTAHTEKEVQTQAGKVVLKQLIQNHTYAIKETVAPTGYILPTEIVASFKVNEDGSLTMSKGTLKNQSILIENERCLGSVELIKLDVQTLKPLADAEFTLSGKDYKKVVTSDGNGKLHIEDLPWGDYVLQETKAPNGYKLDTKEHHFSIDATHLSMAYIEGEAITNQMNSFTIMKTDSNGNPLTGAAFVLKDVTDETNNAALQQAMAGMKADHITLEGLLIANHQYELSEVQAPIGYQREKTSVKFLMQTDGTILPQGDWAKQYQLLKEQNGIRVLNAPIQASIIKTDGKHPQAGVEFTLTPRDGAKFRDGSTAPKTYRSSALGTIDFSSDVLADSQYTLHEEKALNGYAYADDVLLHIDADGIVSWNQEVKAVLEIKDDAMKFTIVKTDDKQEVVAGRLFSLQQLDNKATWTLRSDQDGNLRERSSGKALAEIIAADASYILKEASMKDSPYIDLHGDVSFTINREGKICNMLAHVFDTVTLADDGLNLRIENKRTTVSFMKVDEQQTVLADAKLAIYADNNGQPTDTIVQVNEEEMLWTTNTQAHEIRALPQGTYWLKEVTTPNGYVSAQPIQFKLDAQGHVTIMNDAGKVEGQCIIMTDNKVMGQLQIKKTNRYQETLSDVQFTLYKADGTKVAEQLTTDENGIWKSETSEIQRLDKNASLNEGLEAGDYYLVETKTQDAYQLPLGEDAKTYFTIKGKKEAEIITQPNVLHIEVSNASYTRTLTIHKLDAQDGAPIANTLFSLVRVKDSSDHAVVEDPIVKATTQDGSLQFTVNKKGTYVLRELQAANGYVLNDTPYEESFTIDDTTPENIILNNTNRIENQRQTGCVTLSKTDALSQAALDGAIFTLYKDTQKIGDFTTGYSYGKDAQGKYVATVQETGKLLIKDLAWGDYRIVESKAADGYQLEAKEATFTIGRKGTEMLLEVSGLSITNLRSEVNFTKLASYVESCSDATLGTGALPATTTRTLAGATFSAYDEDGTLFATAISDETGNVRFTKMLADHTYTIKETKAPEGYLKQDHTYQVHMKANGQSEDIIDLTTKQSVQTIVNQIQRTDIVLKKVSENDETKLLSNGVYGLYRLTSDKDEHPQLIATATTATNGLLCFEGVLFHQIYRIQELSAPEGSHRSKHAITFQYTIEDGKAVMKMLDDGEGTAALDKENTLVWREPDIMVSFNKTDNNGKPLANASLAVVDENDQVLDSWISDGKPHTMIHKLTAGKTYRFRETKAPKGYTLSKEVSFTVETKVLGPKESYVQEVTMQNALTSIIVEKRDKQDHALVKDAVFAVYDAATKQLAKDYQGNAVTWTSQGSDTIIGLPSGNYILHEMIAPKHYQCAKDIPFTLQEDGTLKVNGKLVDKLIMLDEKVKEVVPAPEEEGKPNAVVKPEGEKPSADKSDSSATAPVVKPSIEEIKTSDTSHFMLYASLGILSFCGLGLCLRKRKKKV